MVVIKRKITCNFKKHDKTKEEYRRELLCLRSGQVF